MNMRNTFILLGFCLLFVSRVVGEDSGASFQWTKAAPHDAGRKDEKIDALLGVLKAHSTAAIYIVRHDRVVLEWYSEAMAPDRPHYTASLAKALVGGMSLLLALQDGKLNVDDPADKYIPEWKGDPTRAGITIRHLATHSSGMEDAEAAGMAHDESGGWKSRFWKRKPDPFTIARDWAPMKFKPGRGFEYSNPGMAMLSYAIASAYRDSPYPDIRVLLSERVMAPIGVPDKEWSIGYGATYDIGGLHLVANWGGGAYSARAAARVGRLMLRRGDWEGKRILDADWISQVTSDAGTPTPYRGPGEEPCPRAGLGWWVNSDGVLAKLPRDAFMGAGAGNQVLLVIPSLDLIAVRFGELMQKDSFWGGIEEYLMNPLVEAVIP